MDDTVWFQIVVLFGKIFRYSVLFLVFTVFTSIMYFFLQFPFKPPSKIRPENPKASGFLPPALRAGFLRGVIIIIIITLYALYVQDNAMQQEDTNNNPVTGSMTDLSDPALASVTSLPVPTLQSQPTAAASVADFYRRLQKSQGKVLDGLHTGDTCLAEDYNIRNYAPILESLADEQKFEVKFLALESLEGVEQSLVQIMTEGQPHAVTVCLGMGDNSQSSAAR